MTGTYLQMVFALAFVVSLIFAVSFFYRKRQKSSDLIRLLAYQSFGQRMGVAAVRIGDEILILGITPTDFRLLKKISDTAVVQAGTGQIAERVRQLKTMKEEF